MPHLQADFGKVCKELGVGEDPVFAHFRLLGVHVVQRHFGSLQQSATRQLNQSTDFYQQLPHPCRARTAAYVPYAALDVGKRLLAGGKWWVMLSFSPVLQTARDEEQMCMCSGKQGWCLYPMYPRRGRAVRRPLQAHVYAAKLLVLREGQERCREGV